MENFTRQTLSKYIHRICIAFVCSADRKRIWLIFSHLQQPSDRAEEQLIVTLCAPAGMCTA